MREQNKSPQYKATAWRPGAGPTIMLQARAEACATLRILCADPMQAVPICLQAYLLGITNP